MRAYKLELLVIDHQDLGEKEIKGIIENTRYISPRIMNIKSRDIGEWTDEHPLNQLTCRTEYNELFV